MNKLKYYAKKATQPKKYIKLKPGFEPKDREILDFIYDHKPIMSGSDKFYPSEIYAEPVKQTAVPNGIILMIVVSLAAHLFLYDVSEKIFILIVCVSYIIGWLYGWYQIQAQIKMADKFNKS